MMILLILFLNKLILFLVKYETRRMLNFTPWITGRLNDIWTCVKLYKTK